MKARTTGFVAATPAAASHVFTDREVIDLASADLTTVSAVVVDTSAEGQAAKQRVEATKFGIPILLVNEGESGLGINLSGYTRVINPNSHEKGYVSRMIETAAREYEEQLLPPFFGGLVKYTELGKAAFDCPGHQGGRFFAKHPAGRRFVEYFGDQLFRADLCNADVEMGDLLIHEGAPEAAETAAAKVFNADRTYFVLNGTSSSNKVVLNAILTPGDVVLFDRNNHKSIHHGALFMANARPVYLETARNAFGLIGGIDQHCFDEDYIRERLETVAPDKAKGERPIRLAVIQLGTYDGTIYNARQVVDRIGHLCDYILFDSAWVGYEQFIPMMKDCSPLLLELGPDDPGIIVTQSVHKQQAGFSQSSQIHKKDSHIEGQKRYVSHDRFNNSFMMHASTSPFYPIFASLDVNAKMHADGSGERMWADAVKVGIEARKMILNQCKMIKPFVPTQVNGRLWQDAPTEEIANDRAYFAFDPKENWHGFDGYQEHQYFVDPNKLLLTTPGLNAETFEYEDFGIPANILAMYLRQNNIVPEKCDLNSILFLMTPAETIPKMQGLVAQLVRFEQLVEADAPLADVLPKTYAAHEERYRGYTIRQLCQEMHDLYKELDVKSMQKAMFREETFPERVMSGYDGNIEFQRGNVESVALRDVEGRIAAEGALPYPPGVLCVIPGERWGKTQANYFLALQEGINRVPGFAPELQGVHPEVQADGSVEIFCYVLPETK